MNTKNLKKTIEQIAKRKLNLRILELDRNRGLALGIDKITIVNPIYFAVGENGSNAYKSEKGQEELNKILTLVGKKSKLEVDIIDVNKGDMLTTESFNNAAILNEWMTSSLYITTRLNLQVSKKRKNAKTYKRLRFSLFFMDRCYFIY